MQAVYENQSLVPETDKLFGRLRIFGAVGSRGALSQDSV